jgi:predicted DNA-binding protein (MmcQ/YjbR family)
VGHRGWLGVYLDVSVDWSQIADLVEGAYREVAPGTPRGSTPSGRALAALRRAPSLVWT